MPLIAATSPTVTPALPSATYEGWFLYRVTTLGDDPNNVQAVAVLRKAHQDPVTGAISYSPSGEMVTITLGNILISTDPNVQNAVTAVMAAAKSQAQLQGIQL